MMRVKQAERRVFPLLLGVWLFVGPAAAAELPQVVVLATGGTIAGELKKPGEAGYVSGQLAVEVLIEAVPEVREARRSRASRSLELPAKI
jgi:L-asparaginase